MTNLSPGLNPLTLCYTSINIGRLEFKNVPKQQTKDRSDWIIQWGQEITFRKERWWP